MYKVGILSKQGRAATLVRAEIGKSHFFDPILFVDSMSFVQALKNKKFQAFVILTDEFKLNHIQIIRHIKKYFPDLPVIIITERFEVDLKIKLAEYKKTILINLTSELKDINGIIMKLINNVHVIPRLASRYVAAQPAKIKLDEKRIHSAWVLNLAQDGACFRVFNRRLKTGDHIKIEIPLPELKKSHTIMGKVIWEKVERLKNNVLSNSQKIGIQFLNGEVTPGATV